MTARLIIQAITTATVIVAAHGQFGRLVGPLGRSEFDPIGKAKPGVSPGTGGRIGGAQVKKVNAVPGPAYPYNVSLRRRGRGEHFCGGALIGSRHVLTAAHCVFIDALPTIVIGPTLSSQTTGKGVQKFSTKSVTVHPGYITQRRPDFAILELDGTSSIPPVGLPKSGNDGLRNGVELTSMGWGRTSRNSGISDTVQIAKTKFIPLRTCAQVLRRGLSSDKLCSGGDGTGSCTGDGGGPLIIRGSNRKNDVLVGIVGALHSCGGSTPDVDTRVSPFVSWIEDSIR